MNTISLLKSNIETAFNDKILSLVWERGELTLTVKPEDITNICLRLRDESPFQFEQLIDLAGVDYQTYGQSEWSTDSAQGSFGRGRELEQDTELHWQPLSRFAVTYHLLSIKHNQRLRVKTFLDDNQPMVDSVHNVWSGSNWFEREAFDLFGILFNGHPDLRRILTDYGFIGHPFRKDFPLIGEVEVRYDPEQQRVIYQPVTIKPRVLVPRTIRHDNRYATQSASEN